MTRIRRSARPARPTSRATPPASAKISPRPRRCTRPMRRGAQRASGSIPRRCCKARSSSPRRKAARRSRATASPTFAATSCNCSTAQPTERSETMPVYVDGFVAAVPTAKREDYRKHAELAAPVFKEHGALKMVEGGDDVPDGKLTSFPMAVKKKDDETVVFSWIVWPSRQARDEGMKKVMADPRIQPDVNPMPFDGKRLIYGGFEVLVDA